ncbi:hypothetical protein N7532_001952 [Penicillium argentinense]|uniref:Uncharacterized protein n=1 Tax=Penicillium argentinense TaxID=1131581 RepID=A0A9W9G3K9_9EURO|nr:uncharacterized protein N7532_001952 [Penicillium argentinense]KAJ5111417.1 hypothetical protein N7532_001952 [Penicillium argentinense]
MRWQLPTTLLLSTLSATPALAGQEVVAVWSSSTFSTSGKTGTHNFSAGFALVNQDGESIYSEAYPDGYNPCTFVGQEFQLEKGCFGGAWYSFRCQATQTGIPQQCEVRGPEGNTVGTGEGEDQTDFFGVGIAKSGACRVKFELVDGIACGADAAGFSAHHSEF